MVWAMRAKKVGVSWTKPMRSELRARVSEENRSKKGNVVTQETQVQM